MKRTYILICCLIFILLILFVVFIEFPKNQTTKNQTNTIQSPTPISLKKIIITPTQGIGYTTTNNDKTFANEIDNKPQLSLSDNQAKQNLITSLATQSISSYATDDFKVMYIKSFDIFQVELETTDIKKAEDETVAWFATKGISKDGVCKLPVQFYPNFQIDHQLQQKGIQIPPLAIGC